MASNAGSRREQLRRQQEAAAKQKKFNRMLALIAGGVALALVAVLIVVFLQNNNTKPRVEQTQITPSFASADASTLLIKENPGKPVVTLYFDFQCPHCKTFEATNGEMLVAEADAGTWTLQNSTMLFMEQNIGNRSSTRAARAATCAPDPETFSAMTAGILAAQPAAVRGQESYSDEVLRVTVPRQVGLAGEALTTYQACYDGEATLDFVRGVDKAAYDAGVTGTPTVTVNGKIVQLTKEAETNPAALKALILANA